MLTATRTTTDPATTALARIADRGITVEPWTARGLFSADEPLTHPVLYLVEADAEAPFHWGELEEWVRLPASAEDLYARADRLLARAWRRGAVRVEVDDDDILHVDTTLTILSHLEARLLRLLLARRGDVVTRDVAVSSVWPDGAPAYPRAIDNRLKDLRERLEGLPLQVLTVRGRGFALEWDTDIDPAAGSCRVLQRPRATRARLYEVAG